MNNYSLLRELQELYDVYYRTASSFYPTDQLNCDSKFAFALGLAKWRYCSTFPDDECFWLDIKASFLSGELDSARALCLYMQMKQKNDWEKEIEELFLSEIDSIESGPAEMSCYKLSQIIFLGCDLWKLKKSAWLNISLAKCVAIALNDFFDVKYETFFMHCSLDGHVGNSAVHCSVYEKFLLLESIATEAARCSDDNLWYWVFSRLEFACLNRIGGYEIEEKEIIRPLALRCWLKSSDRRHLTLVTHPFATSLIDTGKNLQQQAVYSTLFILKNTIKEIV